MSETVRKPMVFIVDDDEAMRDSMRYLFESVNLSCKVFSSAREFIAFCDVRVPACLVLDIRMPGMSGMDLLETLGAQGHQLRVIVITGHGDVPLAVRAMKQGAFDFLQKTFSPQHLLDRVYAALDSIQQSNEKNRQMEDVRRAFDALTSREREVLELVVGGSPSKAIGTTLGISSKTVEIHRASIMRKLDVRNIAELVQRWHAMQERKQ